MIISLSLLENSEDFLESSLTSYLMADEQGEHVLPYATRKRKQRWKSAYIDLVQATELLIKDLLVKVSPFLILSDIDSGGNKDKTISFSQCISRLVRFSGILISDEEITLLKDSARIRNSFIHSEVEIVSESIKKKYSRLFKLYRRIYQIHTGKKIAIDGIDEYTIAEISSFAEKYTIVHGHEIAKNQKDEYEKDVQVAQIHTHFLTQNGTRIPRIRYGDDPNDTVEYCDDCWAKKGQYHLSFCDLERCPNCGGQVLSCDCRLTWDVPQNMN